MGYSEDEAVGRNFSMFYGPDDLAARKPQRELEDATRDGRVEDEGWRIRKDGTRFWANTIITLLRDPDGTIRGFAKVTRDMTKLREAQEQLRQSTEIFQLLVSSVRDYAIFLLDPQGHIATWNAGAERIKGYKPSEIIGRHFSAFYSEEDIRNGKPERELEIAKRDGSVEDEGWRLRKDGTRFWANVVITAVYDSHRQLRGFAKVTRDVTERRQAEETERALLVAQEGSRAKDEFLMTLSHELRTPMTAVLGWARMLPGIPPNDPMFRDAVNAIAGGAKLQARLIDDILDVSRIVSGKMRLNTETIEAASLITNAVDTVIPTAEAKEITITTSLAPGLGLITADSTRLQQVIWNLVTNAVKFTPRKGSIRVLAQRTPSHLEISVSDTGEGIDTRFLPHIFEPFRQAESPQTRTHGGLGLGLSIVRYIVEAHGGTVSAESKGRGTGSTFVVRIPVKTMLAQDEQDSEAASHRIGRDKLRDLDIVLVDDDSSSRNMVKAVLRAAGASVREFESVAPAIVSVDEVRPDIIITDIAMPATDGYSFVHTLRGRDYGPQLRIIALSAFPANDTTGFDKYLLKPIDPFDLVDQVRSVAQSTAG